MKDNLNILILGSGGREAALAETLSRSIRCAKIYCSADMGAATDFAEEKIVRESPEDITDFDAVAQFCIEKGIDLVVPGPEELPAAGIRDVLENNPSLSGMRIITPSQEAARLESSKEYAKEFMSEAGIPSPRFMPVDEDTLNEGINFIDSLPGPYVLKADGLAQGRGVLIIEDKAEAKDALEDMIHGMFGEASKIVLIEEYVRGRECSVIIATDGEDYIILPAARDYKRRADGDTGPNTPGMGAYSPVAFVDEEFLQKVKKRIIDPTLRMMRENETDYQGFLYFGIMELDGEPLLLEYNVRLGDPETQVILPRIKSDFIEVLEGIADRTLSLKRIETGAEARAAIILLDEEREWAKRRVATITGTGATPGDAAADAYAQIGGAIEKYNIQQPYYRTDIGSEV